METRGIWTDLIPDVGLRISEVFDQGQEQYVPGIGNVLTLSNGEGAQKNYSGKTGVGRLVKTNEGDDVSLGRRFKTYTTQVAYTWYTRGVQVTKLQIEDRDFDAVLDEMKDLSIAANYTQDESGMQLFNGGFSTATVVNGYDITLYGDGVPTYSTVHPSVVPGASTQSNASSTGLLFGHDNLEVPMVNLVEQKTDDGIPMVLSGKPMLILPPALQKEGQEVTQSELQPQNANHAINVYRGMIDMAVSTHLGTTNRGLDTQWFVVVPGMDKQYHETRQAPSLEQGVDILSKTVTFTVDSRWADYVKDWRRKWGSKGDLTAYSS